ncbi:MAG: hypothetical protein JO316_26340 [Abitibacteriaceae bacterium]|nr:hypothetical protein [Abditibacteriaceae bacterium]
MLIPPDQAKTAATLATPIQGIFNTYIAPKMDAIAKERKVEREVMEYSLGYRLREYFERSYRHHSIIKTLALGQPVPLMDLYLPLTVTDQTQKKSITLDAFKAELIPSHRKILLTDLGGMGKSTVMKFLFISAINENAGLPIFIELRHLKDNRTILDIIYDELNNPYNIADEGCSREAIMRLIGRGDFIFFLDGYDEIPKEYQETATQHLQDFVNKAGKNLFILTSRPETALLSFSDFAQFSIEPLTVNEAYHLIGLYSAQGGQKDTAQELINDLQGDTLNNVKPFLTNPLLVSLLYRAYLHKPTIHSKKHLFFAHVYEALFEGHDLTKGGSYKRDKYSGLDIDDFDKVLRVLSFITVKKGEVEYTRDQLLSYLAAAKEQCAGITFKETSFIEDLVKSVSLFTQEGIYYKWVHKSIQEYFAAKFICYDTKNREPDVLRKIAGSTDAVRYINLMELCYEIDYRTFRNTIIYDLIKEFLNYYENSYMHLNTAIKQNDIHIRKLLCFSRWFVLLPELSIQQIKSMDDINTIGRDLIRNQQVTLGAGPGIHGIAMRGGGFTEVYGTSTAHYLYFLGKRGEPIIATLEEQPTLYVEENGKSRKLDLSDIWQGDTPIIVTDDPKSAINDPSIFSQVNYFLSEYARYGLYSLDINACQRIKQEIEEDLSRSSESDFLLADFRS